MFVIIDEVHSRSLPALPRPHLIWLWRGGVVATIPLLKLFLEHLAAPRRQRQVTNTAVVVLAVMLAILLLRVSLMARRDEAKYLILLIAPRPQLPIICQVAGRLVVRHVDLVRVRRMVVVSVVVEVVVLAPMRRVAPQLISCFN